MADENAHPLESRVPQPDDLAMICRELNACGAKYMVIGGFAVPFASARFLLRTKQTLREKDAEDRMFLEAKIAREAK